MGSQCKIRKHFMSRECCKEESWKLSGVTYFLSIPQIWNFNVALQLYMNVLSLPLWVWVKQKPPGSLLICNSAVSCCLPAKLRQAEPLTAWKRISYLGCSLFFFKRKKSPNQQQQQKTPPPKRSQRTGGKVTLVPDVKNRGQIQYHLLIKKSFLCSTVTTLFLI